MVHSRLHFIEALCIKGAEALQIASVRSQLPKKPILISKLEAKWQAQIVLGLKVWSVWGKAFFVTRLGF